MVVFGEDKKSGGISLSAGSMSTLTVQKSLKFIHAKTSFHRQQNQGIAQTKGLEDRRSWKREWMNEININVNISKYKSPKVEHQFLSYPLLKKKNEFIKGQRAQRERLPLLRPLQGMENQE